MLSYLDFVTLSYCQCHWPVFSWVTYIIDFVIYSKYVLGSNSFRPDQLFKVTEIKQLCYFQHSLLLIQHTFQLIH